jgi:hypothetical protein
VNSRIRQVENKLRKRRSGKEETGVARYVVRDCIIRVGQQQSCVSHVGNNHKK